MKDDREHIDEVFKDAAEKQSFSVPDAFLKDLDVRLDQNERRKKRRGLWWLMFLPLGIFAFFYFSPNSNNESSANKGSKDHKKAEKMIGKEGVVDSMFSTETEKTENDSVALDLAGHIDGEELSSSSVIEEKTKTLREIGQEITMDSDPKTSTISKENIASQVKQYVSSSNENFTSKQEVVDIMNKQTLARERVGKDEIILADSSSFIVSSNEGVPKMEAFSITNDTSILKSTDSLDTIHDIDSTTEMNTLGETSGLVHVDTLSKADSINDMKANDTQVHSLTSEKKAKKWSHEIQLYAGMVNSSPLLGFAAENASEQMIANEQSLWTASYGVKYYSSFNDFDLGIGLEMIKNGENVNYSPNSINQFTIDSTYFVGFEIDSIFNNNQVWEIDSIPVYADTSYVIAINDTNSFTGKNTYSWINIPLNFGYRFELGEYVFIPRLGVDLGFASGVNIGTYAESTGGGFVERTSTRFILSYSLQLEIRRSFKRFHVFVNPYYRSNVMPVISSDIQRRRYHSMGINAGIGFLLNP